MMGILPMIFNIIRLFIQVILSNFYNYLSAAIALTLILHTKFTTFEMIWSFSIWLEALAIIP